jgi:hypothetical protein
MKARHDGLVHYANTALLAYSHQKKPAVQRAFSINKRENLGFLVQPSDLYAETTNNEQTILPIFAKKPGSASQISLESQVVQQALKN